MQGYGVEVIDSIMKVSSPSRKDLIPVIKIEMPSLSPVFITGTANSIEVSGYKFEVVGSLAGSITQYTNKFVSNATHVYYAPASTQNAPIQQAIGDVQSASQFMITQNTVGSFIYDPSMISATQGNTYTTYNFAGPGMDNIKLHPKLPTMLFGSLTSFDNGRIISLNPNPGALIFTLTTLSPVTITRIKTVACPQMTVVSASGCYSCPEGSRVIVSAKSVCSEGIVTLRSSFVTLSTTTLSLGLTAAEYNIDFLTSVSINSFDIIAQNVNGEDYTFRVTYVATQNLTVRNDTQQPGNVILTDGPASKGWNFPVGWNSFIDGIFGPTTNWISVILFTVTLAIVVAGSAIAIWFVVKICTSMNMKAKKI